MSSIENVTFDELKIGQKAEYTRTINEEEILLFAKVSGDTNPVHLDEEYAATTQFGGRIAHGMLTGALISAAVALNMPGPGSIYLGQTMKFRAPVMIGDTLTVKLEVISKREGKNIAVIDCNVVNQHGKTVVKGEATALVPTEKLIVETAVLQIGRAHV